LHINIGQIENNKVKKGKDLFPDLRVGNDLYWIQLGHAQRARSDIRLVLENMWAFLGLVMMWPRCAGDGAAESVLVIARLGATTDRQGAVVDRPGAGNDHQFGTVDHTSAASDRLGAVVDHQGATVDRLGVAVDSLAAAIDRLGAATDKMCLSWRPSISMYGSSCLPHGGCQLSWFMTMIWE
jgi:hypothetical protein